VRADRVQPRVGGGRLPDLPPAQAGRRSGDTLIAVALEANRGEPPQAKQWRAARDASHTIVELDFGWRRRLVVGVPHGEVAAEQRRVSLISSGPSVGGERPLVHRGRDDPPPATLSHQALCGGPR
jgi:hypothetical protein